MRLTSGNQLAGSIDYSIKKLSNLLKEGLSVGDQGGLVTRALSYYPYPYYPFSIESCGAILRQGSFIDRIASLGWTEPRTFDQDSTVLYRYIARYHAWPEVMSQAFRKMLVPTLARYCKYSSYSGISTKFASLGPCLAHTPIETAGLSFVDHDDKVEENTSQMRTINGKRGWGVPYHVCGCTHPSQDKPFDPSEKLSRIFRGKSKHPDFTNPSHIWYSREDRTHKHEKWAKQLRSDVDKGKVPPDGWEAMSGRRTGGYEQGFMRPMSDSNLAPIVPYGPETCTAHQRGVLNGANLSTKPIHKKHSTGMCAVGMGFYGMPPSAGFHIKELESDEM
ncbi:hypothetical protein B0J17DRAFT_686097 [Rhizoctonia solani]|nr:hypothetical protein B0J17DRAFT_686097 [Rhizoctonia solani]